MALFHITIEKVVVQPDNDQDIKRLLHLILKKLDDKDEAERAEIMAKLEKAIADIKSTI